MNRDRGELAIVLHTHMPYVEGYGTWPFGEEWLWRAIAESYMRLEPVLRGNPVTIGLSPVTCDQFEAACGPAGDRFVHFVDEWCERSFEEDIRSFGEIGRPELVTALKAQLQDYRDATARFEAIDRDLVGMFAAIAGAGAELLAGPATHPILPQLATDFGVALQLDVGIDSHRARFGDFGGGLWLPECAYREGTGTQLRRAGVSHFCIDQTKSLGIGSLEQLEPFAVADHGPVAAPIDWQTIELVWNEHGYPSAAAYRSTFNRTLHDLMPYANLGEAYDRDAARTQARAHAKDFLTRVGERLDVYRAARDRPGLCVFAVDTELLGHWWYEGPWWLADVFELAADAGVAISTLGDAIACREPAIREPGPSTWGAGKNFSTWDSSAVSDITWRQRAAELSLYDLLMPDGSGARSEAALRAARELLALQASDWAFMVHRATADQYPRQRFEGHMSGFLRAVAAMSQSLDPNGGDCSAAKLAGLAPALTSETLAKIRCDH